MCGRGTLRADLGRNDGFGTDALDGGDNCVRVVAAVSHHDLGLAASQQGQDLGELCGLTAGKRRVLAVSRQFVKQPIPTPPSAQRRNRLCTLLPLP